MFELWVKIVLLEKQFAPLRDSIQFQNVSWSRSNTKISASFKIAENISALKY
jgi:hypothetical protein